MTPRAEQAAVDWVRSRRSQAEQARRQAAHYRRLAEIWDESAERFEAELRDRAKSEAR